MDFWCSLLVEIVGGLATGVVLGIGAAWFAASQQVRLNNGRVADLLEDNRRWFRDTDSFHERDLLQKMQQARAAGVERGGAPIQITRSLRSSVLHAYRDEISVKRRRYREIADSEGWLHRLVRRGSPLPRFELTDEQRTFLAGWREPVKGERGEVEIPDLTGPALEPDIRRFEEQGDG